MAKARPNILFVLTDQQMAGTLGCYGAEICRTPHADALAREGLRFSNAYAACPICTPARASIQTGLYPFRHGMQTNIYTRGCMVHELPDSPELLSRRLQSLGYATGYTGKWHLGFGDQADGHPEFEEHVRATPMLRAARHGGTLPSTVGYEGDDFPGHGGAGMQTPQYRQYLADRGIELRTRRLIDYYPDTFEVLSGTESTVSHFLADNAIRHMRGFIDRRQPFFYMLNFWGPHSPYHASSGYVDLYRDVSIPPWPSFDEPQTGKPAIHNAHRTERLRYWKWEDFEETIRHYYAAVTEIDAQLGRVVEMLKQTGQYDNTVIVFASDHGDAIGVHRGLSDKALFMYEETNRVPLIIRDPGSPQRAGHSEERFAGTCDLYSTVLDYAGLDRTAAERDGRSLRPLVEGAAVDWRDCMVTECSGLDFLLHTQRAIRYRQFKYVFNCGDRDELYDLGQDPHELDNLADKPAHAELLRAMRIRLDQWMGDMGDGLRERYRRLRDLV
jgi:arylsulfatase A-like enzyme